VIDMIYIGQELQLRPGYYDHCDDERMRTGKVVYINLPHSWFILEYETNGGAKVREAFKFSQINDGIVR